LFHSLSRTLSLVWFGNVKSLEWAADRLEMALRQMEVHGGMLEFRVTQEDLNSPKVGAGLQHVGGETVPAMPHAA